MRKLLAVLALALAAVLVWAFLRKSEPPRIVFSKATRETISSLLSTNGKVEPIEYVDVRAEASGLVRRVPARLGDSVRAGQLLAELSQPGVSEDTQASEARVEQARAALETLKAGGRGSEQAAIDSDLGHLKEQRDAAQRNFESLQRLQKANAATLFEVEQARETVKDFDVQIQGLQARRAAIVGHGDLDAAQARLRETEANLTLAKTHAGQSAIAAPMAGTVYDLPARPGVYLNPGDPVASVGRLDPVRVKVYVDEPELGRVATGESVRITWDALPGREWTGTVERKPTEVVALGSRQVGEVLCTIGNPNRDLVPGTNVNAFILTNVVTDALTILKTALRHENGLGVYLLRQDNTIHWQTVTTGVSDAFRVEALTGVHEGDAVAVSSEQPLKDGMKVDPVNQ